jgi:hypothetical protein
LGQWGEPAGGSGSGCGEDACPLAAAAAREAGGWNSGSFQEIEGVGGRAGEDVLVQDLFGQGANEGFAVESAVMVLFGALEDVTDMEGVFGGQKYVIYDIHIRLTLRVRRSGLTVFGAAEGAQGAELGEHRFFQDFNEVVSVQWIHKARRE